MMRSDGYTLDNVYSALLVGLVAGFVAGALVIVVLVTV
jgi:hypothetical protein